MLVSSSLRPSGRSPEEIQAAVRALTARHQTEVDAVVESARKFVEDVKRMERGQDGNAAVC